MQNPRQHRFLKLGIPAVVMQFHIHAESHNIQIDAFRVVKEVDTGLKGNIRLGIIAKTILILRSLPHDTVTGAGPDIGKETQMRQFLPEQPWIMHFCIPEHEQRRRIFTAKRFQQLQFVQERQGKFLVAVPLYIHGKTGLIILRLQVVSDKFRKTLFKTVNLIAFQSQTGSLTVAPELDQVSGTGVKRIIHVQGMLRQEPLATSPLTLIKITGR